ncbi:hypothetical protein J2T57_003365 [Natronocella acetinitrilica]|uniref:Uncharacterized protein n=1 Tax=Natronocella acetinitrilica TaxID=414046 RepID=A0AAE3KCX5_9GAMM|nr:BtrH N-terminal domain-containing protein [Natronocella acetinitrilica]MCP1676206.1 hypothetical protein [Natronocella acetinitrilica]
MSFVRDYESAYYSMTWMGPKGYPEQANSGRCYFTGLLGMFRYFGEDDVLFADGISGDGFSFRWCPVWGAPAFNGGKSAFHELWEYTPRILGFEGHWEEDDPDGWDGAWSRLRSLVDRGIPVQVGLHYSLLLPYGAKTSPRIAFQHETMGPTGFGHHVVVTAYDLDAGSVTIYEPNDVLPYSKYDVPVEVFRRAWEESQQRGPSGYEPWAHHHPWGGEWSLHDGYGPYLMVWVEPERNPEWDIKAAIRDSFRRNLKILSGEYPRPYALFGNQWQIPRFETGAPGMAACARAIERGELGDAVAPGGDVRPLFVRGNIPNHGVLGRLGASGYLRRVAHELENHGLPADDVMGASQHMAESSELFKKLRYTSELKSAGSVLSRIADQELQALEKMQAAYPTVRNLE